MCHPNPQGLLVLTPSIALSQTCAFPRLNTLNIMKYAFSACPAGWLRCRTYDRCVPASTRCDRNVDCLDESDEENCGM